MKPAPKDIKANIAYRRAILERAAGDDVKRERAKMEHVFGEYVGDPAGLCDYKFNTGQFGLFFSRCYLDDNTIAHEVFHATHRILEWANCNFDAGHHEQGAMLNGYLSELVRNVINLDKKARVKRVK